MTNSVVSRDQNTEPTVIACKQACRLLASGKLMNIKDFSEA